MEVQTTETTATVEDAAAETQTTAATKDATTATKDATADKSAATNGEASPLTEWRTGLEGEHLEFAKRLASPHDAVKVALDLRKANSSMIRVPGEGASAEDIAKYRKTLGVPEKATDYKFDLGREPNETDKPVIEAVSKVFHENGVPAPAATAVSKAITELAKANIVEAERVAVAKCAEADAALRKEWGADSDRNFVVADRALKAASNPELEEFLKESIHGRKIGAHPGLVKAFAFFGLRMGEGDLIGSVGESERASLQERLNGLYRDNPPGTEKYKDPAIQLQIRELSDQLYGTGPAPGFGARAM